MAALHHLAFFRGKAYVRDCIGYLGIAVATVPLGLLAQQTEWGDHRGFVLAASAIPPTIATLVAARRESSSSGATPGKLRYGLQVHGQHGEPLSFSRALLRNSLKIALPWQLGHTVAVGAAFGGFDNQDPVTIAAAVATYPLLAVMLGSVAFGEGRALHDRITGSQVLLKEIPQSAGRIQE